MTPETREALTGLADAVKLLAEYSEYSVHVQQRADRLIRALEQEAIDPAPVQPLRRPTINLISAVKLAVLANGGFAHKKEFCECDPSVNQAPCRYCAIHEGLTKAFTFLRALEMEDNSGYSRGVISSPLEFTPKKPTDYETWRDEQLDTLRKLYNARGPGKPYLSFPEFCFKQWDGSDKGKVKI